MDMNLDTMDCDDLMTFWATTNSVRPIKAARELFPGRPKGYVTAFKHLGGYAANKATAISCRIRGDINAALMYESICENIYQDLPAFARW